MISSVRSMTFTSSLMTDSDAIVSLSRAEASTLRMKFAVFSSFPLERSTISKRLSPGQAVICWMTGTVTTASAISTSSEIPFPSVFVPLIWAVVPSARSNSPLLANRRKSRMASESYWFSFTTSGWPLCSFGTTSRSYTYLIILKYPPRHQSVSWFFLRSHQSVS